MAVAVVRGCIYCLLYGNEITLAVLVDHKIVGPGGKGESCKQQRENQAPHFTTTFSELVTFTGSTPSGVLMTAFSMLTFSL